MSADHPVIQDHGSQYRSDHVKTQRSIIFQIEKIEDRKARKDPVEEILRTNGKPVVANQNPQGTEHIVQGHQRCSGGRPQDQQPRRTIDFRIHLSLLLLKQTAQQGLSGLPISLIGRIGQAVQLPFHVQLPLLHGQPADRKFFAADGQKTQIRICHHLLIVK